MDNSGDQLKTQAAPMGETPQNRVIVVPKNKDDGSIAVIFAKDDLEVRADFTPPQGQGEPIGPGYIKSALDRFNIVYGIRWDVIENARTECNMNRTILRDVCIARGDAPRSEVNEYYELNPSLKSGGIIPGPNGMIDHRAYSPFTIVKKDQILAQLKKQTPGRDGRDVHGAVIPHGTVRREGLSGGTNTRSEGGVITAAIGGQMIEKKGVLSVQETLVIKGAVGYTTGNIIFPGDVVIEGPVSDGFKIYSGGSVTIKQTFDATDAVTKTDLNVAGGIIGRGRALIKTGGALRTKFIENCRVACRKTITVESEIINSSVFTMENLEMGDKGTILGGEIYAIHGIRAGSIGRKDGRSARIHCGIDFTAQQELEKQNNTLRILAAKLGKLREFMAAPVNQNAPPEKQAAMEELLRRLEDEQRKSSARATELMDHINADRNAQVEVNGEIHGGTLIEICEAALFVTEPLRKVRVRLDPNHGKLITESL